MERETWLKERRKGIGGTDISAITGLNPYVSKTHVWQEKLGLIEVPENEVMKWGKRLERAIADEYAEREGVQITQGQLITRERDGVKLMGTPDFLVNDKEKGLEVKTASAYAKGWGDGNADIPQHYFIQCQWYMMLLGYKRWDLAVLIGGNDYRVYRLEAHPNLQEILIQRGVDFWKTYVETQEMPPPDSSDDYTKAVSSKIENADDPIIAGETVTKIANALAGTKMQIKQLEEQATLYQNQLLTVMKDGRANRIHGDNWIASAIEMPGRKSTNWKQVTKDMNIPQETLDKHTKLGQSYRVFRFKHEAGVE